jgi:hypothetical protein
VHVDQPMVLISQVQRSGGTLLNSLLDGHPELHSHPYELMIGHPTKYDWPRLDLSDGVEDWLDALRERILPQLFAEGYRKDAGNEHPALPFPLVPSFVERLFRLLVAEREVRTSRDVLDAYFTAFFAAWIDVQGYRHQPKRWVSAFTPRAGWGDSRGRFFHDYPDGRLVSILRDPRAWFASVDAPKKERFSDFDEALGLWLHSTDEMVTAKRERPESVLILTFEALVRRPEEVMRGIADWLGLGWDPILLVPTLNQLPTFPNSSHPLRATGIRPEPRDTWRTTLADDVVKAVEEATFGKYEEVRAVADLR